ncbi:MAG: hypothetical protein NTV22_17495 [bacterium]|nr:hypothetical protein [bacterium]
MQQIQNFNMTPTQIKANENSEIGQMLWRSTKEHAITQLKAPATAKFAGDRYVILNGTGMVTGYVDAQNSFGAMIRNEIVAEFVKGKDDQWHMTDFAMDQPK